VDGQYQTVGTESFVCSCRRRLSAVRAWRDYRRCAGPQRNSRGEGSLAFSQTM